MKKLLCVLLGVLMIFPAFVFAGCGQAETLKFGLGVYTNVTAASDATEDADGQGKVAITAAAVTVDADGKIVACALDTADITVKYTAEGKAVANGEFKTKYEMGTAYNMVAYGGATKEWFEQADAFEGVVAGKTLDEVKALVAEADKGTEEVITAGCTIMVKEFVLAIEKAYNNAAASNATAANTLKLGTHTEQSPKDATEDKDGQNQTETTFFAAAVDANGKVVAASTECVQVKFTFDAKGASTYDLTKAVAGKKEAGTAYNMSAYGTDLNGDGTVKEWNEQAAVFESACIGKTASEITALMADTNYGTADLQSAGCTILVNGFVKAAAKIG